MGQSNIFSYINNFISYYITCIFPGFKETDYILRNKLFCYRSYDDDEFEFVEFDEPISLLWVDTFMADTYPDDVLHLIPEEWYDTVLYNMYEKINVMFFQIISFEEYFLFFVIYLVFVMIINGVISEITWFTHLFNKRNSFQFFKQPNKQIFSFLFKYTEGALETKYYSYLYLHFFY